MVLRRKKDVYAPFKPFQLWMPFYHSRYRDATLTKFPDLSGNANHGTIVGAVPGTYPMLQQVASGSVTLANMRLSAVNGTSFVDFSAADVLTDYLNHLLVVKDSANRAIQGYIKAAGTGETLGSDLVLNGGFDSDVSSWTPGNSAALSSIAGGQTGNCLKVLGNGEANSYAYQLITVVVGRLYQFTSYCQKVTCNPRILLSSAGPTSEEYWRFDSTITDWNTQNSKIFNTDISTNLYITLRSMASAASGFYSLFDTVVLKQVLTPSATGVTITSAKGGGTFNWTGKSPSFNYNDSSNYTYTIYSVPGYTGLGWFADGIDDRFVHSSLNLGTTHTLHYWLVYEGISGVIHGGAANYHGLRLTPTACGYNVGSTEVTVTHSASQGRPVLFSIDRNGTSVDFYQNGVKIGATQTLLANNNLTVTDFLRYSDGTSYWNGILFDVVNINTNKGAQEIRNFFEMNRSKYGI